MAMVAGSAMGGSQLFTSCQHFGHHMRTGITSHLEPASSSKPTTRLSASAGRSESLRALKHSRNLHMPCGAAKFPSRQSARGAEPSSEVDKKLQEQKHEVRVCINKTCRKSGSLETLEVMRSLAPPNVTVESCSCIGKCGAGPNLVILPAELMVSHCNTAAHAARLLALQCGAADPENNLKALALKQQANKAFERGDLLEAEQLYSEAIELNPTGGLHFIYANRSALRLAQGNYPAALEDAEEAGRISPQWAQAYVRQADALSAMGHVRPALAVLSTALRLDPSLRRSKGFQAKSRDLESKLATAAAST